MIASIAMFGLIAEDVVHVVEGVLKILGVRQSFLGLTLIALTPAATELASAIKFALAGQINLSVEIGSASAVQVHIFVVCRVR
jgi:Ca2+:H+ antiporter